MYNKVHNAIIPILKMSKFISYIVLGTPSNPRFPSPISALDQYQYCVQFFGRI